MLNSSPVSWGVNTAVGSSKMRMRAPRNSALMISTRWRSPTAKSLILAKGSRFMLYFLAIWAIFWAAVFRSSRIPPASRAPIRQFSTTVMVGTSIKC